MYLKCVAVFAALFLAFAAPCPGAAQDVTLTSRDGSVEISGNLLGFDGEFYRVDTIYGELTVDGSGVRCDGPGCPNLREFVAELAISGSASMGRVLLPVLVETFASRNGLHAVREARDATHFDYVLNDGVGGRTIGRFSFRATNTDEGFADLLANEADLVMSLREIRPGELKRAREAGMGDMTKANRSRVLALDAMVPIVSPGNPIKSISTPNLARVISGEISNWSKLGGPDAPITLHLPGAESGLGQAVEDRLLAPVQLGFDESVVRYKINSELADAVARDPFAIGVASFAETGNAQVLTLSGSCGFSLSATRRSIKTEDYPLTAPMFLYLPARRLPKLARDFLAFVRDPAAQIVIRRAGFVDQTPEEIPLNDQGDRFANAISVAGQEVGLPDLQRMVEVLTTKTRLTTSFRFEAGSSRLDAQSRSNVVQLARAIEAGQYDARELTFVGFSDGDGPAEGNKQISLRRAEAVRSAIIEAAETANLDRVLLSVDAFGEAMPMACDDSEWGKQVNRRVEVWVR